MGTKGTVIGFPISPTRFLVMDDLEHQPDGEYYPLDDREPRRLNTATLLNSNLYLISAKNIDNTML